MTNKNIYRELGGLDPDLIAKAAPDVPQKKPANKTWVKWASIAACLALAIMFAPALIHIFTPSEIDDPKSGAQYNFRSYSELCSVLPNENIITNIPNSEHAKIEAYAVCPETTTDFADYNNYSYLFVDVSYDEGTGVTIVCTFRSEETAKEYVENTPLKFPPDNTGKTTVSNCDVYYTNYYIEHEGNNINVHHAVFSIDGCFYELTSDFLDQDALIQYIEDMLK